MSTTTSSPTAAAAPPASAATARFGAYDALLYGVTVFGWSTSWIAMRGQIGIVAPEVSLLWRFLLSAAVMWVWVVVARLPVRFSLRTHLGFAAMGVCIFSMNFDSFYHAAKYLPSGLLSVVFSLASVINLAMGRIIFGHRMSRRVTIGGLLGFLGVAAMFAPRILESGFGPQVVGGLALSIVGTVFFCAGNMLASVVQRGGIPVVSATAWGMTWSVGILVVLSLASGARFDFDPSPTYVVSLVWLALAASVVAFWAYLTLLGRIGAARAGYATVMFPVFALAISTVAEGYQWTWPAVVGLVAVLTGNLFVLRR